MEGLRDKMKPEEIQEAGRRALARLQVMGKGTVEFERLEGLPLYQYKFSHYWEE